MDSSWFGKHQVYYTYNDSGYMSQYLWQMKGNCTSDWNDFMQGFYTYDDEGNLTESIEQKYCKFDSTWVNFEKWVMLLQYNALFTDLEEYTDSDIELITANPINPGDMIRFKGLQKGKNYQLSMFDLNGRMLYHKSIKQGDAVRLDYSSSSTIIIIVDDGKQILDNFKIEYSQIKRKLQRFSP